jgi:long-chain acyl-CoA synthetase
MLSALIKEAVEKYQDKAFIVDRELYRRKEYTYKEIYDKALSLCSYFEKKDIKKGDKIIIYLPNSSDYASLLWACTLSGVVAVPIDFNTNQEFAEKIYKNVMAKLVFCSVFKQPSKCKRYYQEEMSNIYDKFEGKEPNAKIHAEDIFEIVYTSGTMADPKGVILTNKNLCANIESAKNLVDFNTKDFSFLSILPLSHLFEQNCGFFLPMVFGLRIVYGQSRKSSSIIKAINEEKIKMMVTVPLFLESIKEKIEFEAEKAGKLGKLIKNLEVFSNSSDALKKIIFYTVRKKLGNLQYFIAGGASLDIGVEKFWRNLGFTVLQGYGLTETSPVLACNTRTENKAGTVGKPISGVEIKIAEDKEILAKGENVFQGYYENEEKTRETLKDGWIYTGDLGEFDEEGYLKITGRKKNIIISSSGLNIYPEDIEKILNKLENVKESVVLGLEEGKKIVAVILSGKKIDAGKLLKEANSKLQQNQYLSRVYQWPEEDFPRTPTKKVMRRFVEEKIKTGEIEKKTKKEEIKDKLVKLVSEVLEAPASKIKEKTLLRNLGMDSLKRIDLAIKIEEAYNLEEFNEDEITEKTKISDLRKLVERASEYKPETGINFLNSSIFDPARFLLQEISFWISRAMYSREVKGLENLPKKGPIIFISNHVSMLDSFSIFKSLPLHYRLNLYPAGAKDFFFEKENRLLGVIARIGFNVFAFSRTKGIKQSLRDFGNLINKGGNILIYPEGTRSWDGKLQPFKQGIGLLVWNLQVPVIPIKLEGLHYILPRSRIIPRTGHVKVIIGKPITFSKMQSAQEITKILEKEMKKLK